MLHIDKEMHEAATAPLLCAGISTFEPMKVRFIMRKPEAFSLSN
jgi:D-arabinose 1-dehydrogenase-like Zn-dependent alcohol dehydrogenase